MHHHKSTDALSELCLQPHGLLARIDLQQGTLTTAFKDWFSWHWDTEQVAVAHNLIHFIEPDGTLVGIKAFPSEVQHAPQANDFQPRLEIIPMGQPENLDDERDPFEVLNIPLPDDVAQWPLDKQYIVMHELFLLYQDDHQDWSQGKGYIFHRRQDESFEFTSDGKLAKFNQHPVPADASFKDWGNPEKAGDFLPSGATEGGQS